MRDDVAAVLEAWTGDGRALNAFGPNATSRLFRRDPRRRRVMHAIKERYLDLQYDVGHDGACAVVTAGPPGVGKSTAVAALGPGYRVVDPDVVKDMLIEHELLSGTYDRLLALSLPDGRSLYPRELAGLVHVESTAIANDLVTIAVARLENVVVEGTLQWWPHALKLLGQFEAAAYKQLSILSCDAPEGVVQERALTRWWEGRESFADGLGGRFVPASVIAGLYTKTIDSSDCRARASDLFHHAVGSIPSIYLREQDLHGVTERRHTS